MIAVEIAEFLRARIAEDEAAARKAIEPDHMYPWGDPTLPRISVDQVPNEVRGYLGGPWGEHFARHDPARVLAECEAKREIIQRCQMLIESFERTVSGSDEYVAWTDVNRREKSHAWANLYALARPYVDHEDCREEWRP